jgi:uroporphyrinogen-III synthase
VLYTVETADRLSAESEAALGSGTLDGVLVYSPRTGRTLVRLVEQAGLSSACRRLTAFCLSQAVAAAVRGLPWRGHEIADSPDQEALIRKVAAAAGRPPGA